MNYRNIMLLTLIGLFGSTINAQEQKEIKLDPFSKIEFKGSAQWVLIPSDEEKVVIESTAEDVFNYINIDQSGSLLTINTTDKNKNISKLFKSVTINVYFISIESVSLSGVGSINTKDCIQASSLRATLRGTGNMHINVKCTEFIGNMYGTAALYVKGTADKATVKVEGVGSFNAYELIATDMNITVSGVGGATIFATNKLTATLNGVGSIKYKGNPETKEFNTNGLGRIKKYEE